VQAQTKVWFDTDIMIGMPDKTPREVDDGITLIMALKPQIEIVGISSITYVDYSYDIINKILKWHNKGLQFQYKDHQKQMIWVLKMMELEHYMKL
jgi:pyrimidine-specific ribonucleoside hydrolase